MIKLAPKPERKRVETDIVHEIMLALSRIRGVRVARNNVGTLTDARGIPVTYGLGDGSPDLVGVITFGGIESTFAVCAMLEPLSVAFAIEVKQPGRYPSKKQRTWIKVAKRRGFAVGVARSDEDAIAFVNDLRHAYARKLVAIGGALA
jgi:hypothetical protein